MVVMFAALSLACVGGCTAERPAESDPAEVGSTSPTGDTTSSSDPSEIAALTDGVHTGYLDGIGDTTLVLRPATMVDDEDAPNGFSVVDEGDGVELQLSASASVTLIDNVDVQPRSADLATLRDIFAGQAPDWFYGAPERFFASVTVADGVVTGIDEVYLP